MKRTLDEHRSFLKDSIRLAIDFRETAQNRGAEPPPIEKPAPPDARRIDLVRPQDWSGVKAVDLTRAIADRRSVRTFLAAPLTLDELSYLLWATQGIRSMPNPAAAFRTVPSAGCRHSFETYLCSMQVAGLEQGIYRYLPIENQLVLVAADPGVGLRVSRAALGQAFVGKAAVTFVWTTVPSRMEWRYGLAAHKTIAIDAGHVCQNLYLACAAVNAGTCAVAAYDQEAMDALLGVDGREEFTIYLAPVGKVG